MLRIGIETSAWSNMLGQYAQRHLNVAQLESVFCVFENKLAIYEALKRGEIDFTPEAFKNLPTQLPSGLVVTAISERESCAQTLVVRLDAVSADSVISLKAGSRVAVNSRLAAQQLSGFQTGLDFVFLSNDAFNTPSEIVARLEKGDFEAVLFTFSTANALNLHQNPNFKTEELDPREFISEPGQGVVAYIAAADDLKTRRALNNIHHPELTPTVNVERRLKQLFSDAEIAAYCAVDAAGNYHLWAAISDDLNTFQSVRVSQSTRFELAERAFQKLSPSKTT
jgi:porphobilinogen deaminase